MSKIFKPINRCQFRIVRQRNTGVAIFCLSIEYIECIKWKSIVLNEFLYYLDL